MKHLLALVLALSLLGGDYPRTLYSYPGRTPTIDGILAPGEWDDALEFKGVSNWIHQSEPSRGLSVRMFVKHDAAHLYLAFDTTGDQPENDAVAIFLNPSNQWNDGQTPAGDGASWSLICYLRGGLAGANNSAAYQRWIRSGAQRAVAKAKPGGHGYIIEWAVSFNPCLEVEPGKFYSAGLGDRAMGLNIAIYQGHAIEWLAGNSKAPTELRNWGTLWMKSKPINDTQPMKILRD